MNMGEKMREMKKEDLRKIIDEIKNKTDSKEFVLLCKNDSIDLYCFT